MKNIGEVTEQYIHSKKKIKNKETQQTTSDATVHNILEVMEYTRLLTS